jgi:hypothetical protein
MALRRARRAVVTPRGTQPSGTAQLLRENLLAKGYCRGGRRVVHVLVCAPGGSVAWHSR